jgi:putative transposase
LSVPAISRPRSPVLLGQEAGGLSPTTITRLTASWEAEYAAWRRRDLHDVHFRVRLEEDRLCTLVMIGVRADGTKELIAVEDGYRESTDSWATVLRDLKRRGLRAPAVAVGDSALGFWAAVGAVWPETREQRCAEYDAKCSLISRPSTGAICGRRMKSTSTF